MPAWCPTCPELQCITGSIKPCMSKTNREVRISEDFWLVWSPLPAWQTLRWAHRSPLPLGSFSE